MGVPGPSTKGARAAAKKATRRRKKRAETAEQRVDRLLALAETRAHQNSDSTLQQAQALCVVAQTIMMREDWSAWVRATNKTP